jgi:hypothetical protein
MGNIYFSLREANRETKRIRKDVARIQQLCEELDLIDNTKIEFDEESVNSLLLEVELNKSFHEKNLELYETIGRLIREGCIIRNIETVEIDFYSRLGNRDIMLCWKPGEDKIKYWHEAFEPIAKRKPVALIEKKYFQKLNELK